MPELLSRPTRRMGVAAMLATPNPNEISQSRSTYAAFGGPHNNSSSPVGEMAMARQPASYGTPNTNQDVDVMVQQRVRGSTVSQADGDQGFLCLCPPLRRIPRPRNAFMLYRQFHQAQVSADNPRLSNPEISKIIGRQWREEAPCVQGKWQRMAQKEKEYHRQQHPNYRYRPRRGPRPNDGRRSGSAPTEGSSKCSRCNGNLASAPRNGSTQSRDGRTGNRLARQTEEPPHSPDTDVARWTSDEPSPMPGPRLPLSRGPGGYEPETMEVRRYREDDTGDYHLVSGHPGFYGGISPVEPRILASRPAYMRPSFAPIPTPASVPRSRSFPMPPPPRPWEQDNTPRLSSLFSNPRRLPPLPTAMPRYHGQTTTSAYAS